MLLFKLSLRNFHILIESFGLQHCSGINCITGLNGSKGNQGYEYLFSGSRDGTLKRWVLGADEAVCGATFESHVDWVSAHLFTLNCHYESTWKGWLSNTTCTVILFDLCKFYEAITVSELLVGVGDVKIKRLLIRITDSSWSDGFNLHSVNVNVWGEMLKWSCWTLIYHIFPLSSLWCSCSSSCWKRIELNMSIDVFLQVNDVVVTGEDTLVSCSSDTTLKVWLFSQLRKQCLAFCSISVLG